ncbi:unnamed protein product [Penicillium olsonii]|uniref:Extracellular serine-rich protein n=1 Tax=Penicillium olsonii TaxID=99116 RepID=A0A9W4HRG1_PENOL|nr:unnamed protein product [Penicillium olsonii]CAG8256277.1 unnamed protein product [Penicillium olsonii]
MMLMRKLVWPLLVSVLATVAAAADSSSAVATGTTNTASTTTSTGIATHTFQVGPKSDPHQYVPTNITANVGDVVVFEFYPTNHSVVKADFLSPCVPASAPIFYSGAFDDFNENEGQLVGPPTFFYCTAIDSCQKNGMVGVINPNSTQTWQAQYEKALKYPYMLVPGQSMPAEGDGGNSDSGSDNSDSGGKHGLSTGAIAGIAVAGVAFLAILGALFFVLGRNRVYSRWVSSQDGRTERTRRWALFNHDDQYSASNRKSEIGSNSPKPGHIDISAVSSPDPTVRTFSPGVENVSGHGGSPSTQQGHWSWNEPPVPARSYGAPTELEGHPVIWEAPGSTPGGRF